MVEPHLLVAVRFLPTREGSGTKSSGRRPKNRATLQVSPLSILVRSLGIAVLIYLWDVLGLRFLAPPAVSSASEVLTQTYRSPRASFEFPVTSRASVRLAASSGTQNVCETTKSRNRTGGKRRSKSRAHHLPAHATASLHSLTRCQAARVSVISKSGHSGQTPEAMTQ